jgi:hypothetical protein
VAARIARRAMMLLSSAAGQGQALPLISNPRLHLLTVIDSDCVSVAEGDCESRT